MFCLAARSMARWSGVGSIRLTTNALESPLSAAIRVKKASSPVSPNSRKRSAASRAAAISPFSARQKLSRLIQKGSLLPPATTDSIRAHALLLSPESNRPSASTLAIKGSASCGGAKRMSSSAAAMSPAADNRSARNPSRLGTVGCPAGTGAVEINRRRVNRCMARDTVPTGMRGSSASISARSDPAHNAGPNPPSSGPISPTEDGSRACRGETCTPAPSFPLFVPVRGWLRMTFSVSSSSFLASSRGGNRRTGAPTLSSVVSPCAWVGGAASQAMARTARDPRTTIRRVRQEPVTCDLTRIMRGYFGNRSLSITLSIP